MKKNFFMFHLMLCALLLCACGSGSQNVDSGKDSEGTEDIELTLWTFPVGDWGNPTSVSNLLTGFRKDYPNINISVEYLNYDNGDEKIEQAVADGCAPDLIFEGPERLVANWGKKGWMVDLSDLWESKQADAVYENIREACQYKNGAFYEFPICMAVHCMAINYDMFRAAGALPYINEKTRTWTTEGFINAVHALTAYGQKNVGMLYCKNQSGDQGTRALVNNLYGGQFTNDANTLYTVDSKENRKALQLLYDLEGITFEPSLTSTDAVDLFCKKETAMCFCWNAALEVQQTVNNPDVDFEVFPIAFPTDRDAPQLESGIWGFGIFDSGKKERTEAAKTFIRYMTENDEMYTKAVLTAFYWPVWDIGNIYENDMLMTKYSIFTPYMGDYYQITPEWAQARTAWWQMLTKIGAGTDVAEATKNFPAPD